MQVKVKLTLHVNNLITIKDYYIIAILLLIAALLKTSKL